LASLQMRSSSKIKSLLRFPGIIELDRRGSDIINSDLVVKHKFGKHSVRTLLNPAKNLQPNNSSSLTPSNSKLTHTEAVLLEKLLPRKFTQDSFQPSMTQEKKFQAPKKSLNS
jgi:hypothetical protein